jgi:glycosyltransferase involved in cell wall biosynthesis
MRILMLHNRYLERGGEDTSFQMEADLLRSNGCEVVTYEENNTRVKEIGKLRTAAGTIWSPYSYRRIRDILRKDHFDVMHVQNFFPLISPSAYYAAAKERVAVVQSLRNFRLMCLPGTLSRNGGVCEDCVGKAVPWPGVIHGCYRGSPVGSFAVASMVSINKLLGTWQDKVDAYIALTQFSRDKFVEAGLPDDKVHIKCNSIHPTPEVGPGGGGYGLFIGRLAPEKGVGTMLDAWKRLDMDIPLKIVGTGPLMSEVEQRAEQDGNVEVLGWQDPSDVMELLGRAEYLVFPSEWYEGCPRVIIESLAKGTPVIAAQLGAAAEMIEDGRTGFMFRPGDDEEFAAAVTKAFSPTVDRTPMRKTVRQDFMDKYTASRNFDRFMEIYRAAIDRSRHQGDAQAAVNAVPASE